MGTAAWISIAVVLVLVVLLGLYLWVTVNSIVTLRTRVEEAWRDIALQMQRRADVIPALVDTVREYAPDDRVAFDAVERAGAESRSVSSPGEATAAENHLQQALKSVFGVAESYPKLQASPAFLQLQGDLVDTEDRIQVSRRFYNGGVREFNTKIQVFPGRMVARRLGFQPREFFEAADLAAVSQPPRVQF